MPGYGLMACPTLYPGQTVTASFEAEARNQAPAEGTLYLRYFGVGDVLQRVYGPTTCIHPGERAELSWQIPEVGGHPIAEIGLEIASEQGRPGIVYLDKLTWAVTPRTTFGPPAGGPTKASHISWNSGVSDYSSWGEPFRVIQDEGTGLLMQGTADWQDYRVETVFTPHMVAEFGLVARCQGLRRYYAVVIGQGNKAGLIKVFYNETIVLGETDFVWEFGQPIALALEVKGPHLTAFVDGQPLFEALDADAPFLCGGIALLVTEGRIATGNITVEPV
jgi:hypothetical protein